MPDLKQYLLRFNTGLILYSLITKHRKEILHFGALHGRIPKDLINAFHCNEAISGVDCYNCFTARRDFTQQCKRPSEEGCIDLSLQGESGSEECNYLSCLSNGKNATNVHLSSETIKVYFHLQ